MISRKPRVVRKISVGIYGHTAAGKTRFLYQWIDGWYRSKSADTNEACREFLQTIETQIAEHNAPLATSSPFEKITVWIPNARHQHKFLKHLPDQARLKLVFRDLRGEALSREIDLLKTRDRQTHIAGQVRHCDGFLFFFDPLCSEQPEQIDAHHEKELQRARTFLRYVLRVRANDYFPVLFVQTHLDQLESASPEIQQKASAWFDRLEAMLREEYRQLRDHYPASLLRGDDIFLQISSVRDHEEVLRPIEKLLQLHEASRAFIKKDRSYVGGIIVVVFVLSLLLTGFLYWRRDVSVPYSPISEITPSVTEADFHELLESLNHFDPQQDRSEDRHIFRRAFYILMDPDRTHHALSDKQLEQLTGAFRNASEHLHQMVYRSSLSPSQRRKAASMLDGVGDAEHLAPLLPKIQTAHWKLAEEEAVATLEEVLRRRAIAGSTPGETLKELVATLDHLEHEFAKLEVFSPEQRKNKLIDELRLTRTFLLDRLEEKGYRIRFEVIAAKYFGPEAPPPVGSLVLMPGRLDSPPSIALIPEGRSSKLRTREDAYSIDMPLAQQAVLECYQAAGEDWKLLEKFDLNAIHSKEKSLAPLGMPLFIRNQATYEMKIQTHDYEIEIRFQNRKYPLTELALLWKAIPERDAEPDSPHLNEGETP